MMPLCFPLSITQTFVFQMLLMWLLCLVLVHCGSVSGEISFFTSVDLAPWDDKWTTKWQLKTEALALWF